MTRSAISQSNYVPWLGWFALLSSCDCMVFYDEVQYTKNDWRNRNKIWVDGREKWITIPVNHRFLGQKIEEVEIADRKWTRSHLNQITNAYRRAPCFDETRNFLISSYEILEDEKFLTHVNKRMTLLLLDALEVKTLIHDRVQVEEEASPTERLIQACSILNSDHYVTGPAGMNYLEIHRFKEANIQVQVFDYSKTRESGLSRGLSIVDDLMQHGFAKVSDFLNS